MVQDGSTEQQPLAMLETLYLPFLVIVAAFTVGILLDLLLTRRMQRYGSLTGWQADRVLGNSLRQMPVIWATLAGVYASIVYTPFNTEQIVFWQRVLLVPFILSVTIFVMRLGVGLIDYSGEKRGGAAATVSLSRSLLKAFIVLTGTLILLQSLGVSITPIIAAFGIGGLAVSLAMEETLSNVFSGLYIITSKQVQPGDYVRMKIDERDHVKGYITDITWRCTKIRMVADRIMPDTEPGVVTVPNSRMASDIVVMHYRNQREKEVLLNVQVTSGDSLEYIERLLAKIAQEVMQEVLPEPSQTQPVIRCRGFSPTHITMTIALYADELADQYALQHELVKRLYAHYRQQDVTVTTARMLNEPAWTTSLPLPAASSQVPEGEQT
jgi:small-conductance mechanosensitive channel